VFAVLASRLAGYSGKRYPFHVGDNAIRPPQAAQWGEVDPMRFGDPYRYGHPNGEQPLRQALAEKLRGLNAMDWVTEDMVRVSSGATHGLSCAVQALIDPGDEVLILAPYWPLFRGICYCAAVTPTDVPFYQLLLESPDADPADLIRPYITDRTRAIYVISPNNPNGVVLSRSQLQSIADLAHHHNLWVFSDEAYENYVYDGEHISIATLQGMAERTVTAYTFSKTYAMAGMRVGYVVAPPDAALAIGKVATHSVYNTSQSAQVAALAAVEHGAEFLKNATTTYRTYRDIVHNELRAQFFPAQGGVFVFVDLREHGEDCMPILEALADRGVTLAPGAIFGAGYTGYARLCFSATDADTLTEGIGIINAVVGR